LFLHQQRLEPVGFLREFVASQEDWDTVGKDPEPTSGAGIAMSPKPDRKNLLILYAVVFVAALIWSAVRPHDYFTWFLEVLPAILGFAILAATRKQFPFTTLAYTLILVHAIILMVGGHYTYAEVPLFDWIANVMGSSRNNYDKVGHLAQGFVPAIIAREIIIRNRIVNDRIWCSFFVISVCLAISAFYELIEWWVAVATGDSAEAFLGTQGYVWDTQSDMALALLGAVLAIVLLGRWHSGQIERLESNSE
jgi:putative membrane protein